MWFDSWTSNTEENSAFEAFEMCCYKKLLRFCGSRG